MSFKILTLKELYTYQVENDYFRVLTYFLMENNTKLRIKKKWKMEKQHLNWNTWIWWTESGNAK